MCVLHDLHVAVVNGLSCKGEVSGADPEGVVWGAHTLVGRHSDFGSIC